MHLNVRGLIGGSAVASWMFFLFVLLVAILVTVLVATAGLVYSVMQLAR